jgi:outer membrane translocation and assembly module TamA
VETVVRNVLGRGLALGGRYRLGADEEELRGSFVAPSVLGIGDLTVAYSRLREDLPGVDIFTGEPIENRRVQRELRIQQGLKPRDRWNLLVGYRFKRTTLDPAFPDPVDVAGLTASVFSDTRDDLLDARRGRFLSVNFELAPKGIGSQFTFAKVFAQSFFSRALAARLTWAQGYRLGLGWGLGGQELRSTERFKAGGGNSVRGFPTDALGPWDDFLGEPAGGDTVLILNQELRYHHPSGLGAVVFYDAGNVFGSVGDLGLDLRHAVGAGLRWRSPLGLLRFDVGLPLAPEVDEKRYRLYFSLGQAF